MAYNPDFPLQLQRQSWTCSIRSLQMALNSIGIEPEIGWLQDHMVDAGLVNPEVGLIRADGTNLVNWVNTQWPQVRARAMSPVSWREAIAVIGQQPVMLGGHGWGGTGHWVVARKIDGDGDIALANPAGTGPIYGQQYLSPDRWANVGRVWTMVTFDGSEPVPNRDADLINTLGYLTGDVADALQAIVDTLRRHKP